MTLSGSDIGVLIYANGKWGPGGDEATVIKFLDTAIAIALAESGGNVSAISPTGDYGLFQINKKAHGDLFTNHKWDNAVDNVDMARIVWQNAGKSFSPWSAYKNGSYKKHLGHGTEAYAVLKKHKMTNDKKGLAELVTGAIAAATLSAVPGGSAIGLGINTGDIPNPLDKAADIAGKPAAIVAGALSDTMKWLAKGFLTIGAGLLAALLLALGVWFVVSNTKTGKAVGNAAKDTAITAATKGLV